MLYSEHFSHTCIWQGDRWRWSLRTAIFDIRYGLELLATSTLLFCCALLLLCACLLLLVSFPLLSWSLGGITVILIFLPVRLLGKKFLLSSSQQLDLLRHHKTEGQKDFTNLNPIRFFGFLTLSPVMHLEFVLQCSSLPGPDKRKETKTDQTAHLSIARCIAVPFATRTIPNLFGNLQIG